MITDEDIAKALDRLARTADGELLYRYLQRIVMFIPDLSAEPGALRVDQGRRRFAADLMALMAKGIDESDGSSSGTSDGKRTERVVVFARPERISSGQRLTAREHIRANDPEFTRLTAGDGSGKPKP